MTDPPPFGPDQMAHFKRRLEEERDRLFSLYRYDRARAEEPREDEPEDSIDFAEADVEREMAFAFTDLERERLRLVDEALARIDDGTYGRCLATRETIPTARLEQIPWARYSLAVQERLEEGLIEERDLP